MRATPTNNKKENEVRRMVVRLFFGGVCYPLPLSKGVDSVDTRDLFASIHFKEVGSSGVGIGIK